MSPPLGVLLRGGGHCFYNYVIPSGFRFVLRIEIKTLNRVLCKDHVNTCFYNYVIPSGFRFVLRFDIKTLNRVLYKYHVNTCFYNYVISSFRDLFCVMVNFNTDSHGSLKQLERRKDIYCFNRTSKGGDIIVEDTTASETETLKG